MIPKEKIKAYALKNAIEHNGEAKEGAVLSSLFSEGLKKENVKEIMPSIKEIVSEINSLNPEQQKLVFSKLEKSTKKRKIREGLPQLPNAKKGKLITRLAPEPSKHAHLGHALTFLLNYLYAKMYSGKCLLRFEDANPEKVSQEFVDSILDDIKSYLEIKLDAIRYVSDDMPVLYEYAEKLIKKGKAYICFCSQEKMRELRHSGTPCVCRNTEAKENLSLWKPFLQGKYEEGKAVLRLRGDMSALNHVMRDPVLFRINTAKHYRHDNKYKVWPVFDFYNPIEDHLMKVTHILRSNEFADRVVLQDTIKELLDLNKPEIVQYGRFNVIDAVTQGREMRKIVETTGGSWDDPRLMTLKALKRRGIIKEVFYTLANNVGLSPHQVNLDFASVASISRKLLDKSAERYFFVPNPIELIIDGLPKIKEVRVKLHPEKSKERKINLSDKIFISQKDYEQLKGKEVRLLHFCNAILSPLQGEKIRAVFTSLENKELPRIQWVSNAVPARIMMSTATIEEGLAEKAVLKLKPDSIIQFERFGFCRLDKKSKTDAEFWFAHK